MFDFLFSLINQITTEPHINTHLPFESTAFLKNHFTLHVTLMCKLEHPKMKKPMVLRTSKDNKAHDSSLPVMEFWQRRGVFFNLCSIAGYDKCYNRPVL